MAKLVISPAARQDLLDIFDFIARDKPIFEQKCELIATTPNLGEKRPEYGSSIRSSQVGRYVIFFRPIQDGIVLNCQSHHLAWPSGPLYPEQPA
jgi:toxin ParE1/3/4